MKKSTKLMALLAVLCLVTSSFVGSTLAKYVTSADANDTARVAKFGVTVTTEGGLFAENYKDTKVDAGAATATVVSSADPQDKVVAPGTKNETGLTFTIAGTPEVDVKLDIEVLNSALADASAPLDIMLAQKDDLPDMTTGIADDTFDNATVYNPVKFTLTEKVGTGPVNALVTAGTLAAVKTALEAKSLEKIDANTDLARVYNLTWAWDFDDAGAGTYDKQDTLLGDLAAGIALAPATTLTDGTDYELDTNIGIRVTVTQID